MASSTRPIADPSSPTKAEMRRWQAGYRRAAERQRELTAAEGFDRRRAVALAIDLLDAPMPSRPRGPDVIRSRDVEAVRAIWRRLRAPHVKKP